MTENIFLIQNNSNRRFFLHMAGFGNMNACYLLFSAGFSCVFHHFGELFLFRGILLIRVVAPPWWVLLRRTKSKSRCSCLILFGFTKVSWGMKIFDFIGLQCWLQWIKGQVYFASCVGIFAKFYLCWHWLLAVYRTGKTSKESVGHCNHIFNPGCV